MPYAWSSTMRLSLSCEYPWLPKQCTATVQIVPTEEARAVLEHLEHREHPEHPEHLEHREHLEHLEHREHREGLWKSVLDKRTSSKTHFHRLRYTEIVSMNV